MKTILLTNHYEGKPLEILQNITGDDFILKVLSVANQKELTEAVREADYLIVSGRLKINKEVIDNAIRVRMIQRTGVGLDNIDMPYLRRKRIPLYVNRGINANSVAEYTVMLMLATLKRNYAVNCQIRNGIWKKQETGLTTHELSGKVIGIVGMGSIGKRVARMLNGFNVRIVYTDICRLDSEEEQALNISLVDFRELLSISDIITLHCPYDEKAGYMIDEEEIRQMKDGAILINTARGKLVSQKAVSAALQQGKLSAVGIDVFEEEPIKEECDLFSCDEAILSPHIAGLSNEAFSTMMKSAVDNIRAFDEGRMDLIEEKDD